MIRTRRDFTRHVRRATQGMVLILVAVAPASVAMAQSATRAVDPGLWNKHLQLGPVEGLTTEWHAAPVRTAVPLGSTLRFKVRVPPTVRVQWTGAREIERKLVESVAEVRLDLPGPHRVDVAYQRRDDRDIRQSVQLDAIDLGEHPLEISPIRIAVDDVAIDPEQPNGVSMNYYFRADSIAQLARVSDGRYRTSTNRWLTLAVDVEPAGFGPLVEWRLDGRPQRHLGSPVRMTVYTAREQTISVGTKANGRQLLLDTYRVRITSHRRGDPLPDGIPVTFHAVTDPPGHEGGITWLASTKYGLSEPLTGRGPTFTTRFVDPYEEGRSWFGVRADNAKVARDDKQRCDCEVALRGAASDDTTCLSVDPTCRIGRVDEIRFFRGNSPILTTARAVEPGLVTDITEVCLDESTVAPGVHSYTVEAVCRGESFPAGPVMLAVEPPPFRLDGVTPDRATYSAGDDVVLGVEAQIPGLSLTANFSAMDSGYARGAELVDDLGDGRYRVRYTLSAANLRPTGDYEVRLIARSADQPAGGETLDVVLRYLPLGRGSWRLAGGTYFASNLDRDVVVDPALRIDSIATTAAAPVTADAEPRLFAPDLEVASTEVLGVALSVPEPTAGQTAWLEIAEPGRSGHTRVPMSLESPLSCDAGECRYALELPVRRDRSITETIEIRLRMDSPPLATGDSSHSEVSDFRWLPVCDDDPLTQEPLCLPPPDSFEVSGRITYDRRLLSLSPTPHPDRAPLLGQWRFTRLVLGAEQVLVRVMDSCGGVTDGYTDSSGEYVIEFTSFCGDRPATVAAYSITQPVTGRKVALGLHTGATTPTSFGDLQPNPSEYTVIRGEVGTFTPDSAADGRNRLDAFFDDDDPGPLHADGTLSRTGEVARAFALIGHTLRALSYYDALVSAERLPKLNIVLLDQPLTESDDTGVYFPGRAHMIHVPPKAEWSQFVIVHETAHYFHRAIGESLTNYGRFSEPMANVTAGMINGTSWMVHFKGYAPENMDVQGLFVGNDLKHTTHVPVGTNNCTLANPAPNTGQCQGFVWRILWDLHDPGESGADAAPEPADFGFGEFDVVNGGGASKSPNNHLLNGVVVAWNQERRGAVMPPFGHPEYEDRGLPEMDLVDVLDGMACLYGIGELALRELLHEVMGYDYDFAKCRGPIINP